MNLHALRESIKTLIGDGSNQYGQKGDGDTQNPHGTTVLEKKLTSKGTSWDGREIDIVYHVKVHADPEKAGYFFSTVNDRRYSGASKKSPEKALLDGEKTAAIRKTVDEKPKVEKPRVDNSVNEFFKHQDKVDKGYKKRY
jgi:hypothetical protein